MSDRINRRLPDIFEKELTFGRIFIWIWMYPKRSLRRLYLTWLRINSFNTTAEIIGENLTSPIIRIKKGSDYLTEKTITNPVKAIRAKCLDCCYGSSNEVKLCPAEDCPLHPFRFGKNPYRPEEQRQAIAERLSKNRHTQNWCISIVVE